MQPRRVDADYLPALAGLRGVCSLWVVLAHSRDFIGHQRVPVIEMGWFGVDIFFILSGFIISHVHVDQLAHPDRRSAMQFYVQRLARIYPMHLVTTLAVLGLVAARLAIGAEISANRFSPESLVYNLLLVQSWRSAALTWNYIAWSISVEWAAYLLFPIAAIALHRVRTMPVAVLGLVLCLAATIGWLAVLGHRDTSIITGPTLVRGLGGFAAGCFLQRIHHATGGRIAGAAPASGAAALTLAALLPFGVSSFVLMPLASLLILGLACGGGAVGRALAARPSRFLGDISYSLYLVHYLLLELLFLPVHQSRLDTLGIGLKLPLFLLGVCLSVGLSALLFRHVERPWRQAIRRWAG